MERKRSSAPTSAYMGGNQDISSFVFFRLPTCLLACQLIFLCFRVVAVHTIFHISQVGNPLCVHFEKWKGILFSGNPAYIYDLFDQKNSIGIDNGDHLPYLIRG